MIDETVLRLAIAVLPGLMNRYEEAGYTDSSAIYEAFNLAHDCIREIRKTSKLAESAPSAIHNNGSTSPAEIAADMETVDRNFDDYSKSELCNCIRKWSQQLRAGA